MGDAAKKNVAAIPESIGGAAKALDPTGSVAGLEGGFNKAKGGFLSGRDKFLKKATGKDAKKAEKKRLKKEQEKIEKIRKEGKAAQKKAEKLISDLKKPGITKKNLASTLNKIQNLDTSALRGTAAGDVQRLRDIATTEGPTKAAEGLLAFQKAQEGERLEGIELESAQRAQSAFEGLAGRGGAGAGARERLAAQTGRQSLAESQRERRAGALSRLGILSEDEQRKLALQQQLPAQQLQLAQAASAEQQAQQQTDLQKAAQLQAARQFDQSAFQQFQQTQAQQLANLALGQGQQATQFGAAQVLADAQREAARQPSTFDKLTPGVPQANQFFTSLIPS